MKIKKLLNKEQEVEVCDLAPPKLREGAAQQKLIREQKLVTQTSN